MTVEIIDFMEKDNKSYYTQLQLKIRKVIVEKYDEFCLVLQNNEQFIRLGIELNEEFKEKFLTYFYQICSKYKRLTKFDRLSEHRKTILIEQMTAAIIYLVLHLQYDMDFLTLKRKDFCSILKISEDTFNLSYLIPFIENYVEINELEYYEKNLSYYSLFIEKLDKEYTLDLSSEFKEKILKTKVINLFNSLKTNQLYTPEDVKTTFEKGKQLLSDHLNKYGLDIGMLFKLKQYRHVMPQYMAILLLFFFKDLSPISEKVELNLVEKLNLLFDVSAYRLQMLYNVLKFPVQKLENKRLYKVRQYPRDDFINDLKDLLKKSHRLDVHTLLKLYLLTDLDPHTFAKEVVDYGDIRGGRRLIQLLERDSMTSIIFTRMITNFTRLYQENVISKINFRKALSLLNNMIHIRAISLKHGAFTYGFTFRAQNLKNTKKTVLKTKILHYFIEIMNENYPKYLFDDPNIPSASILYLKGSVQEKLSIKSIKTNIVERAIKNGTLKVNDLKFKEKFSMLTNKIYTDYTNNFGVKPDHAPILNSFIEKKYVLGIEVPVWICSKNFTFTGHIDLLAMYNDTLIIADYKPTEKQILKSFPQISVYAYMIKDRLGLKDFSKTICVGFSKDVTYSFTPVILENELLEFINDVNSKRNSPLQCFKLKNGKETDLHDTIEQVIAR